MICSALHLIILNNFKVLIEEISQNLANDLISKFGHHSSAMSRNRSSLRRQTQQQMACIFFTPSLNRMLLFQLVTTIQLFTPHHFDQGHKPIFTVKIAFHALSPELWHSSVSSIDIYIIVQTHAFKYESQTNTSTLFSQLDFIYIHF